MGTATERFYGFSENKREVDMDMREMVDKVKKGEPLYGHSDLSPYLQGVAARNSRYAGLFIHVVPWANFVNHNQVRGRAPKACGWGTMAQWLMLFVIAWCGYCEILSTGGKRARGSRRSESIGFALEYLAFTGVRLPSRIVFTCS